MLLSALILAPWSPASAQPRRDIETVGTPFMGSVGFKQSTADIMKFERQHPSDKQAAKRMRQNEREEREGEVEDEAGPDRSLLPQNPASPNVVSVPAIPEEWLAGYTGNSALRMQPLAPQSIGPNFRAATLSGFNPTGAFPPDCDGAVGPTQYIVGVNGRIVSFNKTTGSQDGVLNLSTDNFFNSVRAGSGTSDPMVRYDRLSGRWFITIINVSTPNRYLIGVSDAASNGIISASTVWTFYFFVPATLPPSIGNTCLTDYPSLGIDANALYMGGDEFCPSFTQTDGFVIRKSSVLNGGPIVVTTFRALMSSPSFVGPFAPRGVDNPDPNATEGYFIGVDGASFGTLDMYRVSDPGGTPSISANIPITVPSTATPFHVPHLGNTGGSNGRVDALDDRLFHAVIRNQQLWTSHALAVDNTGVNGNNTRDGSRWYQFNVPVGSGTPTLVQSGTVFTPTPTNVTGTARFYWMPSIAVSGQGHAAMGFSAADSVEFINAATVGRLASDPLGTMQTPTLLTNTTTAYNPAGDNGATRGRRRWGDYSVTTVDPLDDMSMWTVQMYCDTTNSYGVRVAKLVAPPPATFAALPDVSTGLVAAPVTLSGTSVSGSGFYDPGANLPGVPAFNHLTAVITAGAATGTPPTVVSATYVNPTTVNLVLNTSAATPNLPGQFYTLTITNPDGQSTSAALVHVVAPIITASAGAGGTITPSGPVTATYGANQTFTIAADPCFSIANVLVDGSPVGPVTTYTFNNVTANHTISASFAAGLTDPVTAVTASQVKTGNGPGGTTGIQLTFTPGASATSVEVWRKGYGNYPSYTGGSAPALPGSYPPAGWTLTSVTASGGVDVPPTRDFWYYVAYGKDACSDASPVSNLTGGSLDYHLGDVTDGFTPGSGDNSVNGLDASLLGAHYGASGGALAGFEYLDVGPTTDFSTDGRPTPDGLLGFDDLILYALNFAPAVSRPAAGTPAENGGNAITFKAPVIVATGDVIDVPLQMSGAGNLQAVSLAMSWDPTIVTAVETSPGDLAAQGGLMLSPGPGRIDAAMLGAGNTLSGALRLATVRFRALANGDPKFAIARAAGRDAANHSVALASSGAAGGTLRPIGGTDLLPVIPNPSRGSALLEYGLSAAGRVELSIYSVDGRRVKTLEHGIQEAGRYHVVWDGTDDRSAPVRSGLYFIRLEAGSTRKVRLMTLVR